MRSFLEDLSGYRDLQIDDEPPLPRRKILSISGEGITGYDNVQLNRTEVIIPVEPAGRSMTAGLLTASVDNYVPVGTEIGNGLAVGLSNINKYNFWRLGSTQAVSITGIWMGCMPKLVIVNYNSFNLNFEHENASSQDVNRIRCPLGTQYQLAGSRVVELVRDPADQRWRIVL